VSALAIVETGETLPMSKAEAEALTGRIVASAADLTQLLVQAATGRVWEPMGYPDLGSWAETEVWSHGAVRPRGDALRWAIEGLAGVGLSTRQIAAATGASQSTVSRSLRAESTDSPAARRRQRPWRDRWFRTHSTARQKVAALERLVADRDALRRLHDGQADQYRQEAADLAHRLAAVVEALGGEPTP